MSSTRNILNVNNSSFSSKILAYNGLVVYDQNGNVIFDPSLPFNGDPDSSEFNDSTFKIKDNVDSSKIIEFNILSSGSTTTTFTVNSSVNRNITFPDTNDILATKTEINDLAFLINKLVPPIPTSLLSTFTNIELVGGVYTAKVSDGLGTVKTNVQNNSTGKPVTTDIGPFYDGYAGTIYAMVKNDPTSAYVQGSRVLTTSFTGDNGTYGYLNIISKLDAYLSTKPDFYFLVTATIGGPLTTAFTPSNTIEYTYQLSHSATGDTNVLSFYQDDAYLNTITITSPSVSDVSYTSLVYISGVPVLAITDTVTISFIVNNAIKKFWNNIRVAEVTSTYLNTGNANPLAVNAVPDYAFPASITINPRAARYIETLVVSCRGYNSAGSVISSTFTNSSGTRVRIDTLSQSVSSGTFTNETDGKRKKSGVGQYPVYTGVNFLSTESLITIGNEELQLINGLYKYPSAVNYSVYTPVGPNYLSIPNGTFNNIRWATFQLPNVTSVNGITITISGQASFGTVVVIPGFYMYVKINGVTGWLDGNAGYGGVGNPSVNGEPALVLATSTVSSRVITFGTALLSGPVVVRLGLPTGSTKSFKAVV